MRMCTNRDEKVTLSTNPTTGYPILLCAYHAQMHREGRTFAVYNYAEEAE